MSSVEALSSNDSARTDSLLTGVRRLAAMADRACEPEAIFRALGQELSVVIGADEIHVHHLIHPHTKESGGVPAGDPVAEGELDLVVVYLFGGDGRLSYLASRSERPPGVGWVASAGRSFLADGPRELAASVPQLAAATASSEAQVASALLVPLTVGGEIEAVVIIVSRMPEAPSGTSPEASPVGARMPPTEVDRAVTLVDQAATALALVHARAEAGTDPVTGCMNHRAMRRRLHEEIGRAQRTNGRLACLLLDLDDFKLVNDRHGHAAGDAVLRAVAQALMGEFRAFDLVARYGGDEFVAILPEADLESAVAAAGRALQRLRSITLAAAPDGVPASIGVAQWLTPMTVDELLATCDEALLRGKREGKGRVSATLRDSKKDVEDQQF